MFTRKRTRIGILIVLLAVSLAVPWYLLSRAGIPLEPIRKAGSAITAAKRNMAHIYAEELYLAAERTYDSSMVSWRSENRRFLLGRDYDQARNYAEEAFHLAEQSTLKSQAAMELLRTQLREEVARLDSQYLQFEQALPVVPLPQEMRNNPSRGRMLIDESGQDERNGDLVRAQQKLRDAATMIGDVQSYRERVLTEYFEGYPDWKNWSERTIRNSRRGKAVCLVVDKCARYCILYQNGVARDTFLIEMGPSWIGHKRHEGDGTTPEGIYRVTKLKAGSSTKYYKALLLDYPNEEDRRRFEINMEQELIDPDSRIGGLIEIHGHGGKGADWTDGCIALLDSDMDQLFKKCKPGTQVLIVGSLRPLTDINP